MQATGNVVAPRPQQPIADDAPNYQQPEIPVDLRASIQEQEQEQGSTTNPLKRKLSYANVESAILHLGSTDISQHLPERSVLIQVADFFCVSFHHWIPYIHKQRLQERVRRGDRSPGFDLVLHALVAVALRHIGSERLPFDTDASMQQTGLSRFIVETHATRALSIEGLQAIILIVFDDVSL